jgi:hypothetical protein
MKIWLVIFIVNIYVKRVYVCYTWTSSKWKVMFMSRGFFCKQNLPQQKISHVKQFKFHMYEQQAARNLAQNQLQHGTWATSAVMRIRMTSIEMRRESRIMQV